MTSETWLKSSIRKLAGAGISTARLDCLVLLEDATGKDRAHLLAHPEHPFQGATLERLAKQVGRRVKHEPLAYIRGKTEFYGREFIVNKNVLEPRPESETMIELLKELVTSSQFSVDSNIKNKELRRKRSCGVQGASEKRTEPYKKYGDEAAQFATQQSAESTRRVAGFAGQHAGATLTVVDVGTGSGALAITAKLEVPNADVIATDIDTECLVVARKNAKKHTANIDFFQANLLKITNKKAALNLTILDDRPNLRDLDIVIIANLPYVPDDFKLNNAAMNEPRQAIFGGPDGLDLYRELFRQIANNLRFDEGKCFVFTESLPFQHPALEVIAKNHGFRLVETCDFIQMFDQDRTKRH